MSVDLDYTETVGIIFGSKADTDNGHSSHPKLVSYLWYNSSRLISLQDNNGITDLNDGETRDVLFASKVDVNYEFSPNFGFASFHLSPNASRSILAGNDNGATDNIQNPNRMQKADRVDGCSVHSEPVSFVRCSISLSYNFLG